jgi:hypothetical protein
MGVTLFAQSNQFLPQQPVSPDITSTADVTEVG